MLYKFILATVWMVWAIFIYYADTKAGREISQWMYVAVICSTIWIAA